MAYVNNPWEEAFTEAAILSNEKAKWKKIVKTHWDKDILTNLVIVCMELDDGTRIILK